MIDDEEARAHWEKRVLVELEQGPLVHAYPGFMGAICERLVEQGLVIREPWPASNVARYSLATAATPAALGVAPLPTVAGGYGVIYMDPPWRFTTFSPKGRGRCPDGPLNPKAARALSRQNRPERHYPTMSLDEIRALPVPDLGARDCVLLMWAVDPLLPEALELGSHWGFKYKTVGFTWAKERRVTSDRGEDLDEPDHKRFPMGTGYWTRANPEMCLLFTRGKPKRISAAVRQLIISPRRLHSQKPARVYKDIEDLADGPYLEMFARPTRRRRGWTYWGNDVDKFQARPSVDESLACG